MMTRMTATALELAACAEQVEAHFHGVLAHLEDLRAVLEVPFAAEPVTAATVLAAIEEPVRRVLAGPQDVLGAGFVAARGELADHELYLAWWQGDDRSLLGVPETDPVTGEPFDYTRRPWFRVPERTGAAHVTGPYVDFICTDEYVLTTTLPVPVAGRMVGVVGADTLVESLESMVLPALRAAGATLVNDHSRVVVSADPHLGLGDRVEAGARSVACRGLPLTVVRT